MSQDALDRAVGLTEFLKAALRHLFAEEFAFSKPMLDRQRVLRFIRSRPGCKRRDILRSCSLILKELWPVLASLDEKGRVARRDDDTY